MGAPTSSGGDRLLPRALRRPAAVVSVACVVVLTVLAVRYHDGDRPGEFDRWMYGRLARAGLPRRPLVDVVDAAPPAFAGLVAVLTVVHAMRRSWRRAALATLAPAVALLVTEVGKRLVGRTLDGLLSYPSGHTTGVASVVAMVAVLRIGRAAHARSAALLGLVAVALAAIAIGVPLIALRFHYATDVIGAFCVAVAAPVAVACAIDAVPRRRDGPPRSPVRRREVAASRRPTSDSG